MNFSKNKPIFVLAIDADQWNVTTGTCSVATKRREDIFCPRLYYKTRAEEWRWSNESGNVIELTKCNES